VNFDHAILDCLMVHQFHLTISLGRISWEVWISIARSYKDSHRRVQDTNVWQSLSLISRCRLESHPWSCPCANGEGWDPTSSQCRRLMDYLYRNKVGLGPAGMDKAGGWVKRVLITFFSELTGPSDDRWHRWASNLSQFFPRECNWSSFKSHTGTQSPRY